MQVYADLCWSPVSGPGTKEEKGKVTKGVREGRGS